MSSSRTILSPALLRWWTCRTKLSYLLSTVTSTHWPKCWKTSISLSYGTRYDQRGTLSYMTLLRHRFSSTRFTYRSFMCQLYESRYFDTSNNDVCGDLSNLAMNSDGTADRYPSYSSVAPLPEFLLWPRPKHYAVLWFLTNLVQYIITRCTFLSSLDYIDFMRRTRW